MECGRGRRRGVMKEEGRDGEEEWANGWREGEKGDGVGCWKENEEEECDDLREGGRRGRG